MSFTNQRLLTIVTSLALFVFSLVVGTGVDVAQAKSGEPKRGGRVVIARPDPPSTLDPHKTGEAAASQVMSFLGMGLLAMHPEDLSVQPGLAERWEVSDDGLVYTFYLRQNVTFHTGDPLTAHDFKYTFERALDPATATAVAGDHLRGITDIVVEDDYTLKIRLAEPSAVFARNMTLAGYQHPLLQSEVEGKGADYGRSPISVGPFQFDHWVTGFSITLKRFDDFNWAPAWFENQGAVYPDELQFRYIGEEATLLAALEIGEVDIAEVPPHQVDRFLFDPGFDVTTVLRNGIGRFFVFNMADPRFQDLRVRQAIAHGVNKQFFIDRSLEGRGVPAHTMLPPSLPGYHPNAESVSHTYDVDKAMALLAEAGWTMGNDGFLHKDGEKFVIRAVIYPADIVVRDAELFKNQMRRLGIDVVIESYERALQTQMLQDGDYDITLIGYTYNDPDVLFFFFHSDQHPNGLNYGAVNDPEVDELLSRGRQEFVEAERMAIYHQLQELINERVYVVPVYIEERYIAANARIKGFRTNVLGDYLLNDVYVDE